MRQKHRKGGTNMKRKRLLATMLAAALFAQAALAGCGNTSSSDAGTSAGTDTSTEQNDTAAVTDADTGGQNEEAEIEEQELNIAIFQGGYGDAYWNQMVEKFEETHEGVKINMTISPTIGDIIRPQIVAGNAPDFIYLNTDGTDGVGRSLIKEHALLNLDDVFDGPNYAGTGTLRDDITDGILESSKCAPYGDGEIYFAPFNNGPEGLIYNKTYFEANNLEAPKTWEDFLALGDQVKEIDGRALLAYQGIYPSYLEIMLWPAVANECGKEALTQIANYEEGSFNNEGVIKALNHLKEIADKGYLLDGTIGMNHTESQTEMMLGKALFIPNGTWMESEMKDAPREDGFEYAMIPTPTENADDVHYIYDCCEVFAIPADAKNPELAKEFLRFLYSDESVIAFAEASGALYATKTAYEVAKDKLSNAIYNMYGIYEEANAASMIMSFAAVPADCKVNPRDEIFNSITSLLNGEMTAEELAEHVEEAFAQVRTDMENTD